MKKSKRLFELCGDILFPRRCPFCDAVLGFSGPCAVCGPALACIRRPLRQPVPKQGHALEHLDAAYAPYFYEPPVRDAVLRLKFEKRVESGGVSGGCGCIGPGAFRQRGTAEPRL